MTQPDDPNGRPLTRRELRERLARGASSSPETPERTPRDTGTPSDGQPPRRSTPAPTPSAAAAREARPSQDARPVADAARSAAHEPAPEPSSIERLLTPAEGTPVRPRKRRGGAIAILLLILALIAALVVGGIWVVNTYGDSVSEFFGAEEEPVDYEPGLATGEAIVMIEKGDTGWEVSQSLHEAGVTLTESVFYDMLVEMQKNPNFQPGAYELQQKMTAAAALETLQDPAAKRPGVAFPEGYTVEQIVPVIASGLEIGEKKVRAALADPSAYGVTADSLEGWLFPGSYEHTPGTDVKKVIQSMVDRTRQELADAGVPEKNMQRVLTIASILEREARAEEDFYRVSRVIENRLAENMMLQMDSTAQYGYGEMHDGDVFSSAEALEDDNPWNTYVNTGLPIGPISNPGALAIEAAVNPADGDWLYFVTVNLATGETKFATTLAEHEQFVAELRRWCDENPDSTGCG